MFILRRRSVAACSGVIAAAIGVFALTSLPGASAVVPSASASASTARLASASASSASASSSVSGEGHTKCVPWPKPTSLGLKCTGTYSGNTAFDPWIPATNSKGQPQDQNLPASEPPTVTISQAKDLTDQDVTINWSNFTPTLSSGLNGEDIYGPNPSSATDFALNGSGTNFFSVSIFECNGTNPAVSNNYGTTGFSTSQCYLPPVGTLGSLAYANAGPPNGQLVSTLDTSAPKADSLVSGVPPDSVVPAYNGLPPSFDGGKPSTWIGQATFHVEAPTPRSQAGIYNCGPSTPCSLVIDPNWGGAPTNPGFTDTSGCSTHVFGTNGGAIGDFFGSTNNLGSAQSTTTESLVGGSYACWAADRIVIPLSFAQTSKDCPAKTPQFYAAGSPMMETQMLQWEAGWCSGTAPVTLQSTFESESTARQEFLAGGQSATARTDMALVTLPPDAAEQQASHRKFTYAPLANSGTGIAYYVDDTTLGGTPINQMVLNARLLAKLTTQSYTLQYGCTNIFVPKPWPPPPKPSVYCDPNVIHNPYSLFDDPEFVSLNQHCQPYGQQKNYVCGNPAVDPQAPYDDFPADGLGQDEVGIGGFLPTVLLPESDMTYDLTGWIAANPDAKEFLDGETDPWGMHVNNSYLGVSASYPTYAFSELDNGVTLPQKYVHCTSQSCATGLADESMQASWNFQPDLDTITRDLLAGQPAAMEPDNSCPLSTGFCNNPTQLSPTSTASAEPIGAQALLSVLDLGDIANYQFPVAELVNAAGKAVGPTQKSVEAAVRDMKTNADGITQYANYTSTDPSAYPLAMVDYAMVPTCGLSHTEALAIADFLTKVATTGQVQGDAPGDLAPGYYPLNAKQKAQTLQAAAEVRAQDCKSAPADKKPDGQNPPKDTGSSPKSSPTPTPSPSGKSPSPSPTPTTPQGTGTPKAQTAAFGQKSPDSGLAGILLLLAIIAGALLLLGGPAVWAVTATGKWPVVLGWLRPVQARLRALAARRT
jgi:hypothetical protein